MDAIAKPPKGHFIVLYFASANSFTAKEYDTFLAPLPISKLFDALEEKHSGIKDKILSSCLVTVNLNYVDVPKSDGDDGSEPGYVIQEGDEVAIIPPVSSG
ncbi:molybdopterin synthase sulfur carrier subunit [Nemania abortiva]|nr:molybdopterin synthase sulfur carrier subunit [Nemania abortiva]